jgi:N-acetylglutamate synthase-like GNAT family acetyltransferase
MTAYSELVVLPRREVNPTLYIQTAELILEIGTYKETKSIDQVIAEMSQRTTLVALDEDRSVVGTSALHQTPSVTLLEDVISSRKGEGIGRGVVEAAEDLARRRGIVELFLSPSKQAVGFYTRLKYESFGEYFMSKVLL